jgi:hypothetical protein
MIIRCDYCGKERDDGKQAFVIGASPLPDWVMMEGTGNMCCPECWEVARRHLAKAIDRVTGRRR